MITPNVPYPYALNGKLVTGNVSLTPICSLSSSLTVVSKYLAIRCGRAVTDFLPTQNLERTYSVDKESKAVLSYFQYNQCAGPQKQEVINWHSSTIICQKMKVRGVFR